MRKIAKTLLLILGIVIVIEVVDTALGVWAWRTRNPRALHVKKRVNKYALNPLMLRFSGRYGFSAIVHHVGRRSGTPYATPVIAHQSDQGVVIPLPYGTDVDWLRNLLAAGQGVVEVEGRSLNVDEPAVVDLADMIESLPAPMARTVRFNGAREAVRLHVSEPASV